MSRHLILALFFASLPPSYVCAFTSTSVASLRTTHVQTNTLSRQSLHSHTSERTDRNYAKDITSSISLPQLYPHFANILKQNGFTTPTPIQRSSATRAKEGENLLLIAATGSGKTLAYLLPALSRVREQSNPTRKTILIVAPTRELAAQLARDASLLLPDDVAEDGSVRSPVVLAVRGIPPPNPTQIANASVLVGTPDELYAVLTRISGAQFFIAGGTLSGIILDEVDVLLPPTPKTLRTSFDSADDAKRERQTLEQRRKLRAAQRRGVEFHGGSGKTDSINLSMGVNSQILAPTERILRLVASARFVEQEEDMMELQMLAGSATASRTCLDRLNRALRMASLEGSVIGMEDMLDTVWKGKVKVCRAESGDDDSVDGEKSTSDTASESSHTIRAVTVPSVVDHRYVQMPKETVTNAHEVLAHVAKVTHQLKPETSLIFICGEFSRSVTKEKQKEAPKAKGKTSQARRDAKRRRLFIEKQKEAKSTQNKAGLPEPLSVRKACSILQSMEIDARPMHVALGLEPNSNDDVEPSLRDEDESGTKLPPVLVTFEGSARGLHFDGVDVIFVVGRPTSAASYLHLAGRVGRAIPKDDSDEESNDVECRPGTVVSFCSKGRVKELEKWTNQVGGTVLEEILLE